MYDPNAVRSLSYNHVNRPPAGTHVGTFVLLRDKLFTRTYEVAAWHTEIMVPKGVYPIVTSANGWRGGTITMEGVITNSYTPPLFGGVSYGTQPQGEHHRDVGQTTTHSFTPYEYVIAEQMADPDSVYVPADNIVPVILGWWDRRTYNPSTGGTERQGHPSWALHMEAA
jgi:hypothetical protein